MYLSVCMATMVASCIVYNTTWHSRCNHSFGVCICVRDSGAWCMHFSQKCLCHVQNTHTHAVTRAISLWQTLFAKGMNYDFEICTRARKFPHKNIESHLLSMGHLVVAKHTWICLLNWLALAHPMRLICTFNRRNNSENSHRLESI